VSKAFTRESDDESGAEEIPSLRPQLPPGTRNYITREGADRLKHRLNDLLEKKQAMATMSNAAGTGSEADQRKIESAFASFSRYWTR
jgi:transcription elongation factor GreB